MKFSSVLFDLDGTLVDSLLDLHQAVNHVLSRYGRPLLDAKTVREYIGDGVRVLLARSLLGWDGTALSLPEGVAPAKGKPSLFLEEAERRRRSAIEALLRQAADMKDPTIEEAIDAFRAFYRDHCVDHTRCYPGVEETIAALSAGGVTLGVVSNKPESYTDRILEDLGIQQFFQAVVGGDTIAAIKPDPTPLRYAMEKLGSSPEETLMVGDSPNDILAGRNAGCKTGAVTYGLGDSRILLAYGPDLVLKDLRELVSMLPEGRPHEASK